jgi:hypothetical protein
MSRVDNNYVLEDENAMWRLLEEGKTWMFWGEKRSENGNVFKTWMQL